MTRVVVYERAGCHLCDLARPVVDSACSDLGLRATYVDIDEAGGPITEMYNDLVPCVLVDGVRVAFWRVHDAEIRQALAGQHSNCK